MENDDVQELNIDQENSIFKDVVLTFYTSVLVICYVILSIISRLTGDGTFFVYH